MKNKDVINQLGNPWDKVYWFLRIIINNDKYVAFGKESKLLLKISSSLRLIATDNRNKPESEILLLQFNTLKNILEERYKNAKSIHDRLKRLLQDLEKEIDSLFDMEVFIHTRI